MLSLTPVIKHLTPKPVWFEGLWFRKVDGAAEYARLRVEALPLPAAWVVRDADKSESAGERTDNVTPSFDVVIAIANGRQHEPGGTDDELLKYRRAVYKLLRGNAVLPDTEPVNFHGGRVIEYTDEDLYWADRYSFGGLIDNYLPDPTAQFLEVNNTGGSL
jgi:hypothetical protein